jgi:16S rRNA (cytidine1402-2'-O)-methyltransferase
MLSIMGDRRVSISREMTKIHEEIFRGTLSQAVDHFTSPRGEFTLVMAGKEEEARPGISKVEIEKRLCQLRESGLTAKAAVAQISDEAGLAKKTLYQVWIKMVKE